MDARPGRAPKSRRNRRNLPVVCNKKVESIQTSSVCRKAAARGQASFDSLSPGFSPRPPSDRDFTKEELERTKVREVEALARMMGVLCRDCQSVGSQLRCFARAGRPRSHCRFCTPFYVAPGVQRTLANVGSTAGGKRISPYRSRRVSFPLRTVWPLVVSGLAIEEHHATKPGLEETEEAVEGPEKRHLELAPNPTTVADETVHPSNRSHEPAVAAVILESHKPLPHAPETQGGKLWIADGRLLLAAGLVLLLGAALVGWKWYAAPARNSPTAALNTPVSALRQGCLPESRSSDQPIAAVPDVKTGPSGSNRQTERDPSPESHRAQLIFQATRAEKRQPARSHRLDSAGANATAHHERRHLRRPTRPRCSDRRTPGHPRNCRAA